MIRGLSFRVPQATTDTLWQILGCLDVEKYRWYNIPYQEEAYLGSMGSGEPLFGSEPLDENSFSRLIRQDHYIIFTKLQAYLGDGKFFNISTYEEFDRSDCQLLLLIFDCEFVEIYVKDAVAVKALYENAQQHRFLQIEYITNDNDCRTGMDIL